VQATPALTIPNMNPLGIVVVGAVLIFAVARLLVRHWVVRRYLDGRATPRTTAVWLITISVIPYLALLGLILVTSPGIWWVVVLIFIASWPLIVLPAVLVYQQLQRPK
jgi:hypothetical protein